MEIKNISNNLDEYFPKIYKKVGVSFSSGLESLLILLICLERYGKDNVYIFSQKNITTDNSSVPLYHIYINAIIKKLNLKNYLEIEANITGDTSLSRNGVKDEFLSRAWASTPHLDKIFVGANSVRYGYCSTSDFINTLKSRLNETPEISAPFLNLHKEDTIKAYYDLGYQDYIILTRSCHQPSKNPCGVCSNCLDRLNGFKIAGKKDPVNYESMSKIILLNKNDVPLVSSQERVQGLHRALISVYENKIEGDFVECGVYKGGNPIIAKKFFDSVDLDKKIYCYDTFEGMTPPSDKDGNRAKKNWDNKDKCEADLTEVKTNFKIHDCLDDDVRFIVGDVCETLHRKENLPKKISILRLDTDFYESTKTELEVLFPLLVTGGFLIIDDYGHWKGCRKAVDEYFSKEFVESNFEKLDYTGIMYRKA